MTQPKRRRPHGPMQQQMQEELYGHYYPSNGGPAGGNSDAIPAPLGGYGYASYGAGQYGPN